MKHLLQVRGFFCLKAAIVQISEYALYQGQGSFQILDQVVGIFDANAQSDQGVAQAYFEPLFPRNAGVRHAGWVPDQRFNTAKRFGKGKRGGCRSIPSWHSLLCCLSGQKDTMAPNIRICFFAISWLRWLANPGQNTFPTFGWFSRCCAITAAFSQARCTRKCSVFMPRREGSNPEAPAQRLLHFG